MYLNNGVSLDAYLKRAEAVAETYPATETFISKSHVYGPVAAVVSQTM